MSEYKIRSVGRAQAKILAQIHTDCFAKGWGYLEFESFFERAGVFAAIAYADAKPVGFVLCWQIEEQCDVLSMGVLPDYRRDGVGVMLLDYALATAQDMGVEFMVLEVNINNTAAQHLYAEKGFEAFSTRKNYYSNADGTLADALCMRKKLR